NKPPFGLDPRIAGRDLANAAGKYGEANTIDPGTVALVYGHSTKRWGVAQNALNSMGQVQGAQQIIADALIDHLNLEDMPESTERFLSCLSAEIV
ncbi:MAG: hypothetical protein HQ592_13640, partial [Planctomycetes bacterium]|nr:hypothetical protein [Planctomycetota bacterium]